MPTTVTSGRKVVTTAATAVQLSTSTARVGSVAIQAETDNTGRIAVGGSTVVALEGATSQGIILAAGDSVTLDVDQLTDVYIDSTVNGDGVNYLVTSGR